MPMLRVVTESTGVPVELYYEDRGAGRPVVLIHGWPLSGRSWEYQVGPLVDAGYRVVTYDRRGFGWSSQASEGYEYDAFTDDLTSLMDHLDLSDATLVGFSMGGGEVARYFGRHPAGERAVAAVFAGAIPPYLYASEDNPDGGLDDATVEQFLQGIRTDRIAFLEDFTRTFFAAGDRTDLISEPARRYARDIAAFASPKGTLECVRAFSFTDFREDVAKIQVPTLVLHGDSDAIVPFEVSGRRVHDTLPDSELVVIEGGPHGFNVTHAEQFNRALLEFLGR